MNNFVKGRVIKNIKWTESLFTLIINAPIKPFIAGQFTKLALKIKGKIIQKAYSYVNSPESEELEFYLVKVKDGKFTPYLYNLKKNDSILIKKNSSGFFTTDNLPCCDLLWMFSTGTAIGPFLSILQSGKNLDKFKKIILIHAVRYEQDLSYTNLIKKLKEKYKKKLIVQKIISRENKKNLLFGRIPNLIENGELEKILNQKIDPSNSHVMLCGNPGMLEETKKILNKKGMKIHLKKKPGHITIEQYW